MEFPWTYLLTSAITELRMTEEDFWRIEPRVLINLLNEKKRIDKEKIKTQAIFTASYVWGKDPEENTKDKPIPGIDVPVDASALRGFYG